jgi:glyoxylate reductase
MLSDKIDAKLLDHAKSLKVVANLAVGYDNIDLEAAKKNSITVCHTPDVLTDSTADLAFSLLLAAARRIVESANYVQEGKWNSWGPLLLAGADVHHKTIGIVGMGRIGEAVARRAKGFDMNILYHNRNRKPGTEQELGATYKEFHELLKESDFVVCLAPLTPETKGMFNREAFQFMKKSAIFINAGRGASVDEDALVEALQNGEIAGAGLDVFVKEPIDPNHPLLAMKQVVALPHIGSASVETRLKMSELACRNIARILEGKEAETPVK